MEFLESILNYNIPIVSAFILGLMSAISPCPLATNITATAYISKHIKNKKAVLLSGILYFLGRATSYSVLGVVLYFGASKFHIARFFNQNGEKYLGPLLVIFGLVMLNVIRVNTFGGTNFLERLSTSFKDKGLLGSYLLGIVFALAFCPYSGVLYFGMLIPMTITSVEGLYLPLVFALGTGLPVIIFTYLLAFAAQHIRVFYARITQIELVLRKTTGIIFIGTGLYYIWMFIG